MTANSSDTVTQVSAGRLSALLVGPDLRRVEVDGTELIRRIGFAVRDGSWNTLVPKVEVLELDVGELRFHAEFRLTFNSPDMGFGVTTRIEGHRDERLVYEFHGVAERPFVYNRIGLVLLHPPSLAGHRVITSAAGIEHYAALPLVVEPQWRINDRPRGMWTPFDSLAIELGQASSLNHRFEGDLFEIEDHRNWGDASYKTYSTPLTGSWPYELGKGASLSQTVTISLEERELSMQPKQLGPKRPLGAHESPVSLPDIGFVFEGEPSHDEALVESLRQLKLDHVRTHGPDVSQAIVDTATRLEAQLELLATARVDDDWARLPDRVARVLLVEPGGGAPPTALESSRIREMVPPESAIYMATTGWFASINRIRPLPGGDGVAFPLTPQVHDSDDLTIVENLEAIGAMVSTARLLGGGKHVSVGPITLTSVPHGFPPRLTERPDDPGGREAKRFWLVWCLGCLVGAVESHATATTWGPIESVVRREVPSGELQVTPLYQLFSDLLGWSDVTMTDLRASGPAPRVILGLSRPGSRRVLVGNLNDRPERIPIPIGDNAKDIAVTRVVADGWSATSRMSHTHQQGKRGQTIDLDLEPYGYARIDWSSE